MGRVQKPQRHHMRRSPRNISFQVESIGEGQSNVWWQPKLRFGSETRKINEALALLGANFAL